jgi:hypothetical protein
VRRQWRCPAAPGLPPGRPQHTAHGGVPSEGTALRLGLEGLECSRPLDADLTPADPVAQLARLQGLRVGPGELAVRLDGGEPETQLVCEVVAGTAAAVALDERTGTEVLQTRAGAGE